MDGFIPDIAVLGTLGSFSWCYGHNDAKCPLQPVLFFWDGTQFHSTEDHPINSNIALAQQIFELSIYAYVSDAHIYQ